MNYFLGTIQKVFLLLSLLSVLFLLSSSPFFLSINLILFSFSVILAFSDLFLSHWFNFVLILVYLGGVLVLMTYFSAILPNLKTFPSKIWTLSPCLLVCPTLYQTSPLFSTSSSAGPHNLLLFSNSTNLKTLIFIISLLFMMLLFSVEIGKTLQAPLRGL